MARQSSSPKRKRASLPIDASQQQPTDGNEADVEESQRPKKRGRPRKSLETEQDAQPEPVRPKKRGRPSLGDKAASAAAQDKTKKKRGRPSTGEQQGDAAGTEKTGRRKSRDAMVEEEEEAEQAEAAPQRKGRKAAAAAPPDEEEQRQPSKAGRRRKPRVSFEQDQEPEQEAPPTKRARGRQPLEETNHSGPKTKQKAGPGRKTGAKKTSGDQPVEEPPEPAQPAGRRTSSQMALLAADAPPKPKSLPHITSRTRGIKQSTIDAKWSPLDAPSINAATETLTLAHRPIMQRMSNSQARRQHASSALSVLHRRIARKLQRGLPFPPPNAMPSVRQGRRKVGHEAELDFESVLDNTAALERQLDPQLHAVEVLRREKERVEKELERDYDTLRNLEAGARGEGRLRRDRLRKMHVLAPEKRVEKEEEELVFDKGGLPPGMVFKDLEDGELKDLALQLSGHVDSIKTNLRQADGLAPQLASSRASLKSVLLRHLDAEQYDRVAYG